MHPRRGKRHIILTNCEQLQIGLSLLCHTHIETCLNYDPSFLNVDRKTPSYFVRRHPMFRSRTLHRILGLAGLLIWIAGMLAVPMTALAQEAPKKKNFAQRHPTVTSAAAGIAAYKVAKKTGKNRAAHGEKKNFAQRHPIMTGIGAAVATKHVIKKSGQKK